ncbi:hypothetical protein I302_104116 [Kwoniella bestiolae CBS 10118]|uniref:Uncharacterized protein n=1 Tax=Kwoniella bestiolae CBS 10118 TaxID=1296100 RepID=A0AAJ8K6K6_9TREE
MTSRIPQSLRPILPPHVPIAPPARSSIARPAGVPFYRDPGHAIPTKWALYRPLLRLTSHSPDLASTRREIKVRWRETKGLLSIPRVKAFLEEFHDLLDHLRSDTVQCREEVRILEEKLREKHQKIDHDLVLAQETRALIEQEKKSIKPKMTGSFHRPTLFNPPLPRLKPQPTSIGAMIHNRLRARERRIERRRTYAGWLTDMKLEVGFWKSIQSRDDEDDWSKSKDPRSPGGWDAIIKNELRDMDERFQRENRRAEMVFDGGLLDRIGRAREKKERWWMGLKEREKAEKERKEA